MNNIKSKIIRVTDCNFCPYQKEYNLCEYDFSAPREIPYDIYSAHEFPDWCPLENVVTTFYNGS